jgi:hypothetical protein
VQRLEELVLQKGNGYLRDGQLPGNIYTLDWSADEDVLRDLIYIIADDPAFEYLTSRTYDKDVQKETKERMRKKKEEEGSEDDFSDEEDDEADIDDHPKARAHFYTKDTQQQVPQWKPAYWRITDPTDLEQVQEFLPPWPVKMNYTASKKGYVLKMYSSAAAVAIQFVEQLSSNMRSHLRSIVIQEDNQSVASPKTHAQGLIPFCIANPRLRIERRVDIWPTELVAESIPTNFPMHARYVVEEIATWIHEAKIVRQMGMPGKSFKLVLHGPSKQASQRRSDAVMRAAIWQDGAAEIARREERRFTYNQHGIANDFVDVIKEMLRDEIPARFDAEPGELWDIDQVLREHYGDWPDEVREVFRLSDFEGPAGGWEAARKARFERVDWVQRMDGWTVLTGEQ